MMETKLVEIVSCWINRSAFLSLSCSSEVLLCSDKILFLKYILFKIYFYIPNFASI